MVRVTPEAIDRIAPGGHSSIILLGIVISASIVQVPGDLFSYVMKVSTLDRIVVSLLLFH